MQWTTASEEQIVITSLTPEPGKAQLLIPANWPINSEEETGVLCLQSRCVHIGDLGVHLRQGPLTGFPEHLYPTHCHHLLSRARVMVGSRYEEVVLCAWQLPLMGKLPDEEHLPVLPGRLWWEVAEVHNPPPCWQERSIVGAAAFLWWGEGGGREVAHLSNHHPVQSSFFVETTHHSSWAAGEKKHPEAPQANLPRVSERLTLALFVSQCIISRFHISS